MSRHYNDDVFFSETSYIKSRTEKISRERLEFMGGEALGDVSIGIEDGATLRKIRRIIEKRVSQNFYKAHPRARNNVRHATRRHLSNTMRNLYGFVPTGFVYLKSA